MHEIRCGECDDTFFDQHDLEYHKLSMHNSQDETDTDMVTLENLMHTCILEQFAVPNPLPPIHIDPPSPSTHDVLDSSLKINPLLAFPPSTFRV